MTSRPPFPSSLFSIRIQVTVPSVYCFQCVVFKADRTRHVKTPTFRNCFEIHMPCSVVHLYRISTCTVTVKPTTIRELLKINNFYCVPYTNLLDSLYSVLKYMRHLITPYLLPFSSITMAQTRIVGFDNV